MERSITGGMETGLGGQSTNAVLLGAIIHVVAMDGGRNGLIQRVFER